MECALKSHNTRSTFLKNGNKCKAPGTKIVQS